MSGAKGCVAYAAGGVFCFVLGLIMLFTMVGGGDTSAVGGTLGGILDSSKVPAAYLTWVEAAGAECGQVSAPLLAAQIQQESGWNPNAVSSVGAEGIAQFMPGTWPHWGRDDDGKHNVSPFNPDDAIMAMGRYDCAIAQQVAGVPGDKVGNMLAGYNAGPGAVLQYGGVPPYPQTVQYVASIEALMVKYELSMGSGGSSSFAQAELAAAEKYIGTPYSWGGGSVTGPTYGSAQGASTDGFDCSGLVLYAVYQASGGRLSLPHSSETQATMGAPVSRNDLRPGDAIAVQTDGNNGDYSHIVLYVGNGQIIEAPHTGADVRIAPLSEYDGDVQTIRRFG